MTPRVFEKFLRPALLATVLLAACQREPAEPISVLLVSPDSLRADRLAPWNVDAPGAVPVTPAFERLAARGTVYTNAWAVSPWTAPSMVSVMSGLYPPSHGVAYRDDTTPSELATLPRLLGERGYRVGNFSFFSQISYFRNLGLGPTVEGLTEATVAEGFARWLAQIPPGEPFFAWVHLLETHLPYGATGYRASQVQVPGSPGLEEAQLRGTVPVGSVTFAEGDRERLLELYDRDVVAMDRALGRVHDALEASGRLDTTLVIFVADHGEELLEHGWIGHASTSRRAKLVPEILRIPLVLAGPGVRAGKVDDTMAQQVDILPTVLELLGLDRPEPLDGQLLPGFPRRGTIVGFRWGSRELAFFDSSPGGNLTPRDQRGVRLQGVTDGHCVLEVRTDPDQPERRRTFEADGRDACTPRRRERLAAELTDWRQEQALRRLAVLSSGSLTAPPSSEDADGWAERIEILRPSGGAVLDWQRTRGQIALEWSGRGSSYWLEYRIGRGPRRVAGSFQLEQQRVVFGPVPRGFWNDLAVYSPLRIRLVDAENEERSAWVELEVRPASRLQ